MQKAGLSVSYLNPGTSSPQSGNQQALPKDCVNIHNIFRRGLNLLPRFEFKVASLWIQRLVQLTLHLCGVSFNYFITNPRLDTQIYKQGLRRPNIRS